jgi:hypothetical protein
MDFRLESAIEAWLAEQNLVNDVDIISIAGAAKDLNDGSMGKAVEGQLALSKKLHDIGTIVLMNHTDCGGYGGRDAFESREAEWGHHVAELAKAAATLSETYPGVTIKQVIADIDGEAVQIKEVA